MRDKILKSADDIGTLLNYNKHDILNFDFPFKYTKFYYSKSKNILLQFLFKDTQELVFVSTHNKIVRIGKNDLIEYKLIEITHK